MSAYLNALSEQSDPKVLFEQIVRLTAEHDARVSELLAANNAEVQRRRKAERERNAALRVVEMNARSGAFNARTAEQLRNCVERAEAQLAAIREVAASAQRALAPLDGRVFNDNGDCTIGSRIFNADQVLAGHFAYRGLTRALTSTAAAAAAHTLTIAELVKAVAAKLQDMGGDVRELDLEFVLESFAGTPGGAEARVLMFPSEPVGEIQGKGEIPC
jgi:hypothetical protein